MRDITSAILALALLITLLTAWAFPHLNGDIFLGLCLGREVAHGTFLDVNSWSFILPAQVFVDRAWLSHLVYYLSYTLLGSLGLISVKAIMLACYAAILYYRCRAMKVCREISLLALALGMFGLAPFLSLRGENFGVLCFLVLTLFLTASPSWGRWRQLSAIIILAVWCNCHGTWPMGLLLIGFRLLVDLLYTFNLLQFPWAERDFDSGIRRPSKVYPWFNSDPKSGLFPGPDVGGWLIALVLLIPVLISANPYGLSNFSVFSYLGKFGQYEQVVGWVDNLPLIHPTTTLYTLFYGTYSVLPFLALLGFFGLLLLSIGITSGRAQGLSLFRRGAVSSDVFMEAAVLFMLIPIVFKWRRLIVFASLGLVPFLGLLMQRQLELFLERFPRLQALSQSGISIKASIAASLAVFVIVAVLFFTSVVRCYLPDNPMSMLRVDPPLIDRILSYNMVWSDALEFFKKNGIKGRILAGIQMADYLLLHLTDIQVFMDLRAQAAYSPGNFKEFFATMDTGPGQTDKTLETLDRYDVEFVAFDTFHAGQSRNAARALMVTRKWACIYQDPWIIVLARTNSGFYAEKLQPANLDALWFKDARTKIISQCNLSLFMNGEITSDSLDQLKDQINDLPEPALYNLVILAMNRGQSRLNEESRAYLLAELSRLSKMNYMVPMGAHSVLESEFRILSILYEDQIARGNSENARWFRQLQIQVLSLMSKVYDEYSVTIRLP